MKTTKETVAEKADRILAKRDIWPVDPPGSCAHVYHVNGDHDTYTVAITSLCTCPASTMCSHIRAALTEVLEGR